MRDLETLPLRLHRDHLYIEAAAFLRCLRNVQSVALLKDGRALLILPVASAEAGGYLVKQVNARGDRAIHGADFFRLNGIDEFRDIGLEATWSTAAAAFLVRELFTAERTFRRNENELDA